MNLDYEKITYNDFDYAVIDLKLKNIHIPIVIDWNDLKIIDDLDKNWRCNDNGFIYCTHDYNENTKDVFLHEIIMALKMKDQNKKLETKPIVHINRMGLDNRKENLMYDSKIMNKNNKEKKEQLYFRNHPELIQAKSQLMYGI